MSLTTPRATAQWEETDPWYSLRVEAEGGETSRAVMCRDASFRELDRYLAKEWVWLMKGNWSSRLLLAGGRACERVSEVSINQRIGVDRHFPKD
jgi:hypothetical protein